MADRLQGKVAIVTGAGSSGPGVGNGKAAAILFAREGASVLCVDIVEERAQETVGLICDEGGVASAFVADVSKQAECKAMAAAAFERYGGIDILQNNVGIPSRQKLEDITEEDWDHHFQVNLRSMVMAAQAVVPYMDGPAVARSSICRRSRRYVPTRRHQPPTRPANRPPSGSRLLSQGSLVTAVFASMPSLPARCTRLWWPDA